MYTHQECMTWRARSKQNMQCFSVILSICDVRWQICPSLAAAAQNTCLAPASLSHLDCFAILPNHLCKPSLRLVNINFSVTESSFIIVADNGQHSPGSIALVLVQPMSRGSPSLSSSQPCAHLSCIHLHLHLHMSSCG